MINITLGPTYFPQNEASRALSGAIIYIGEPDTDPEIVANQVPVYFLQENGTYVEITQPVSTGMGGLPTYNGTTGTITTDSDYSLKVLSAAGFEQYYMPSSLDAQRYLTSATLNVDSIYDLIQITSFSTETLSKVHSYFDGAFEGGGNFYWDATLDKSNANGGTIIDPSTTGGFDGTTSTRDVFLSAQGSGSGIGCWVRTTNKVVLEDFGGSEGSANNSPVWEAIKKVSGLDVYITPGKTYQCQDNVTIDKDITLSGSGTIDCDGCYFVFGGTLTEKTYVSSPVSKGTLTIDVNDATGISAGDILIIQNTEPTDLFSNHRTYYYDGEYAEVLSVSSNELTLTTPTETSYNGISTDKVYILNATTPIITDVKFTGDTGYLVSLQHTKDAVVTNPNIAGGVYGAFRIDNSINAKVYGGKYTCTNVAVSTQYGIVVTNSQDVDVYSVDAYGTRHGISVGGDNNPGAVPNRRIVFHDSVIKNAGVLYAADVHGNTIDSGYINCHSNNHVGLSGMNTYWKGGTITIVGTYAPCSYHEVVGGTILFEGAKIFYGADSTATTLVNNLGSGITALIDNDYTIQVENLDVESSSNLATLVNAYNNAAVDVENTWIVKNIRITGDVSNLTRVMTNTLASTGLRPKQVIIDDIFGADNLTHWMYAAGGTLTGCVVTMPKITYRDTLTISIGEYQSSDTLSCSFPSYPGVPDVFHSHSGATFSSVAGFIYTALSQPTTQTAATVSIAGDVDNAVTLEKVLVVSATVGMTNVTI